MEWRQFVIAALVVGGFFGSLAWLRTDGDGRMPPPREPGDADRAPRLDRS